MKKEPIMETNITSKWKLCGECGNLKMVKSFKVINSVPNCICKACEKKQRSNSKNEIVIPETSQCTKCKEVKAASEFNKNSSRSCGLMHLCRVCEKIRYDAKYARRRANAVIPAFKVCKKCKVKKEASDFTKDTNSSDGLLHQCKECLSKQTADRVDSRENDIIIPESKKCSICNKIKTASEFSKTKHKIDGLQAECKACGKIVRDKKIAARQQSIVIPESKKCYQCKETKPASEFGKDKGRRDGLDYLCRICKKVMTDAKIAKIREEQVIPEYKLCFTCKKEKLAKDFNVDGRRPDGLQYDCRECENKKNKAYRESLGEEYIQKNRKKANDYYAKNTEKVQAYQKEYYEENKEYVNKRQGKYDKERYRTDPVYKMGVILRHNLRSSLKKHINAKKSNRTFNLLGCSLDEFVEYFETLFTDGMNWAAFLRGEIHIDHVQPVSSFSDISDPKIQEVCFNFRNLQPLWAKDNMQKGAKLNWVKEAV